jgi:hypothetical protein
MERAGVFAPAAPRCECQLTQVPAAGHSDAQRSPAPDAARSGRNSYASIDSFRTSMPVRACRWALLPNGSAEHQNRETSLASEECFSALRVTGAKRDIRRRKLEIVEGEGNIKLNFCDRDEDARLPGGESASQKATARSRSISSWNCGLRTGSSTTSTGHPKISERRFSRSSSRLK